MSEKTLYLVDRIKSDGEHDYTVFESKEDAEAEVFHAADATMRVLPAWQDRPTCVGLWVGLSLTGEYYAKMVDDNDLTDGIWHGMGYFGPIPDDAGGVT